MLILTRRRGESIVIGGDIEITLLQVQGDHVRLGITAPKEVAVYRKELLEQIRAENIAAAEAAPQQLSEVTRTQAEVSGEKEAGNGRSGA